MIPVINLLDNFNPSDEFQMFLLILIVTMTIAITIIGLFIVIAFGGSRKENITIKCRLCEYRFKISSETENRQHICPNCGNKIEVEWKE